MRVDPGAEHVRLGLAAFTGFAERASFDDDLGSASTSATSSTGSTGWEEAPAGEFQRLPVLAGLEARHGRLEGVF